MLFLQVFLILCAQYTKFTTAEPVENDATAPEELYHLAPGELVPENATFSSADLFPEFALKSRVEQELVNPNPGAWANLFKRQNCQFQRSDGTYTCINANNRCCTYSNNPLDGWCCEMTDACGPGTGLTDCTYRVSWSTSTFWETSYSTRYWTSTVYVTDSTVWSTRTLTAYKVKTKRDLGTATVWETIDVAAANAPVPEKRGVRQPAALVAPVRSTPLPSATAVEKQPRLVPEVTEAPKVLHIRGKLFPRQALRTDTSLLTVTRTTYIYTTSDMTTTRYSTVTSYTYTTVTSTLGAGETAPPQSFSGDDNDSSDFGGGGGGGGSSGSKKGLGVGAKAGIGAGVGVGLLAAAGVASFFFKTKTGASAAAGAAANSGTPAAPNGSSAPAQGLQPGQSGPTTYTDGMAKQPVHGVTPVADGMQSPGSYSQPPMSQMEGLQPGQSMGQPYTPGAEGMNLQSPPPNTQGMPPGQMAPPYYDGTSPQAFQGVSPVTDGIHSPGTMSPPPGSELGYNQATPMAPTPPVGYGTPSPVPGAVPVPLPVPGYYNPDQNNQTQNQNPGYGPPIPGQNQDQHRSSEVYGSPVPGQQQQHHEMAATPIPFPTTIHQQQHSPPPQPQQPYMSSSSPPPPQQQQYHNTPSPLQQQQQYQYPRPPSPGSPGFVQRNQGQYQQQQQPVVNEMPTIYAPQPGGQQGQGGYGGYDQPEWQRR